MKLSQQITDFIKDNTRLINKVDKKSFIVLSYLGFYEKKAATLEDVAESLANKFDTELLTRERIRQIFKTSFTDKVSILPLWDQLQKLVDYINEEGFVTQEQIRSKLLEVYEVESISIKGIFDLISLFKIDKKQIKWELFTSTFEIPTREYLNDNLPLYIITKNNIKLYKNAYKRAVTAPGLVGIASIENSINEIQAKNKLTDREISNIRSLIKNSPEVLLLGNDRYAVPERENTVVNGLKKMFIEGVPLEMDAITYGILQYLSKRTPPKFHPYPNEVELKSYLEQLKSLIKVSENLRIYKYEEEFELKNFDKLIYQIIKESPGLNSEQLMNKANEIIKTTEQEELTRIHLYKLLKNPFIFADLSIGPRKARFFLISQYNSSKLES